MDFKEVVGEESEENITGNWIQGDLCHVASGGRPTLQSAVTWRGENVPRELGELDTAVPHRVRKVCVGKRPSTGNLHVTSVNKNVWGPLSVGTRTKWDL